ncbi:hypothetical protein PoB_006455000 [Plakobranchus ocellatus]|uniref:Transmembrane protein n=1 Tax=Plakobranchus ocellatus TaxID=259542 RepID=A0AAV4D1U3_9GAST|nr:hypothetical protein PoB_006455000 [Plakobranchus ocellatus]
MNKISLACAERRSPVRNSHTCNECERSVDDSRSCRLITNSLFRHRLVEMCSCGIGCGSNIAVTLVVAGAVAVAMTMTVVDAMAVMGTVVAAAAAIVEKK